MNAETQSLPQPSRISRGLAVAGRLLRSMGHAFGESVGELGRNEALSLLVQSGAKIEDEQILAASPKARERAAALANSRDNTELAARIYGFNNRQR